MNADAMTDGQYRIYEFSNFFDLKNLPNDEFERSKRFEDSNIFNCSSVIASAFIFHFGALRALIEHFSYWRCGVVLLAARRQAMRYGAGLLAISVIVFITGMPLAAHHALAAKFDPGKTVTLNGTVVEIDWANPHVHVLLDVKTANVTTNWAIELESPIDLQRSGWSRDTLKPGDVVTVQGISARDGSKQAWANSVVMASSNKR